MGQVQNRLNAGRHNGRIGSQRQTLRRYLAALGLTVLAALGSCQGTTPKPPIAKDLWKFDQDQAWKDLVFQVDAGFRIPGTEPHKKVRDWILSELKKSCDQAWLQEFSHKWSRNGQDVKMWNVIGSQNWESAKQRVVLMAHWDSRPSADYDPVEENRSKPIPGANDGASGVAVLLELARVMKDRHPDLGVMYLMTDGEDLGPGIEEMLLGADYFAKHLPEKKPNYGILIDMIGDADLSIPEERNSFMKAEKLERSFYTNANEMGLGKNFPYQLGEEIIDDHQPMNDAGVPTIDLIDFTYQWWHTTEDKPEHCSAKSLGAVGVALESWLLRKPMFLQSKGD